MEKLNSDEKMQILMNLSGKEINKVCQTSKSMGRICNDERYDRLWNNKIKEEFNVEIGNTDKVRGYEKFKFLTLLQETKIHIVEMKHKAGANLFYSVNGAMNFIISIIIEKYVKLRAFKENEVKYAISRGELPNFLRRNLAETLEEYLGTEENMSEMTERVKKEVENFFSTSENFFSAGERKYRREDSTLVFKYYTQNINF